MTSERISALRAMAMRSLPAGDPTAGPLREESLARTEGEPAVIREAKALAHYYRHRPLVIHDGELLVGDGPRREADTDDKSPPRVAGRCGWRAPWPAPDGVALFFKEAMLAPAGNHTTLDYDAIFSDGFAGLLRRIDRAISERRRRETEDPEKIAFLEALRVVAEGYIDLSRRYADCALELAAAEGAGPRRDELQTIAENCRRAPADAPRTFWEACQCAWFSFFFLPDAPGRVDQYLYPFYRHDVDSGSLTREFAKELLRCLWLKYFAHTGAQDGVSARHHLTLGGVGLDGRDASNEVTTLCLEVTEELRLLRPQVGLRWNRNTPPDLLNRAVRVLRAKTGMPDFCNDEQIVPALLNIRVTPTDARDFSLSGCHEVIVTGRAQMGSVEGFVNMPKILRLALGLEPAVKRNGDLSGIGRYDELWGRLIEAMDVVAAAAHEASLARDRLAAEAPGGGLQASLVTRDCIEAACGYTQGGARYNFCNWDVIGVANLADSLAAVRRLVFDGHVVTLSGLAEVLAADWAGHETLRTHVLRELPHFGNDDDEVDQVAGEIIKAFAEALKRRTPYRGGEYILGTTAGGENMHIEFGRVTGATPDGRRAGEPFADSIGAAQGRDRRGVTALLNSVAKLPHGLLPTATTLNVKLDPGLLATDEGVERVAGLIRGHFVSGGQQVQLNLVSREMLVEARRHPEEHADLMVRVSGYSAPFVSLWDDLQEEIIARMGHTA